MGGTRGIGVVIAPSGIERKSFFFPFLIREYRISGLHTSHIILVVGRGCGGKGQEH